MLVHGFILVECIGFEFKLEFEFKLVECCLEKKRGRKNQKREETQKTKPKIQFHRANPRPLFSFSPGRTSSPFPVGLISLFLFGPSSAAQLPSFYRLAQLIPFPPPHGWPDPARPASPLSRTARARSPPSPRISPAPMPRSLLPLSRRPHLSALSSPPCRASVCWPGRASRRARALGHLRHVNSPAITATSSTRGLRLLEPGTLETDRTGSVVRIRNHRGCVARTPWRLPAPS